MDRVSLKQLRAVAAIARDGRIVEAAKRLHVTASAVTIQLRELERAVGLPLFDRTSSGLRLTEAGRMVLDMAVQVDAALTAGAERIAALKGVSGGRLALGAVSTAKYFAPHLFAAFGKLRPGIELKLVIANRDGVIEALRAYAIDLAIMGRPPDDMPVTAHLIGDHPLVIVAAPDHPLAGLRGLPRSVLSEEILLVRERGSGTRTSMEGFLGAIAPRATIELGSNETIKQAAMAGLGIAFISGHTVASELEGGRLVALDIEGLPVRRQWFAVRRSDRVLSPAAEAFSGFLAADGARHLPHPPLPLYSTEATS